jgi:hypothetical protein
MRHETKAKGRPTEEFCLPGRMPCSNGKPFPPFGPPAAQNAPATLGGHAHKKAVGSLSLCVAECGQILFH